VTDLVPTASSGDADREGPVIDLTEEEFAEVARYAQAAGLSVEEYARQAIRIYLGLAPGQRGVESGPSV
jgi:hypothetical protein